MSAARETVLARVRYAIADRPGSPAVVRSYRREGRLTTEAASSSSASGSATTGPRSAACPRRATGVRSPSVLGARRVAIPAGLPSAWLPDRLELVPDDGLSPAELDRIDGVLTGCTVAIAETGTIVLAGGPAEGRRALTLVPDLHVCVVDERQIVELVPEAMALLGGLVRDERRPLTLVSGPSATSDIELSRVEGVHGAADARRARGRLSSGATRRAAPELTRSSSWPVQAATSWTRSSQRTISA